MAIRPATAFGCALAAVTVVFTNAVRGQAANGDERATKTRPAALSDQIEVVTVTAQKRREDPNNVAVRI
jgi:hypothetical protein